MIKNNTELLRAMSEIDDKYIVEILDEDKNGSASRVKKKNKAAVVRFLPYAVPAAAAVLIVFAVSRMGSMSSGTQMAESAAPAPVYEEAAAASDSGPMEAADYSSSDKSDSYSAETSGIMASGSLEAAAECDAENMDEAAEGDRNELSQIANPFRECADLDEAAGVAGFDLNLPDDLIPGSGRMISALQDEMIQVIFFNGDDHDPSEEILRIRKAAGDRDITGDHEDHAYEDILDISGYEVTVRGESSDNISTALWKNDGYTYAVLMGNETCDVKLLERIVNEIE